MLLPSASAATMIEHFAQGFEASWTSEIHAAEIGFIHLFRARQTIFPALASTMACRSLCNISQTMR